MPVVGLDLGTHSFRAVELEQEKDRIVLKNYGTYENPRINLGSESGDELQSYEDAIKTFFSEYSFSTPRVITSLPESEVFTRVISVPKMSDKELASSISFEADNPS